MASMALPPYADSVLKVGIKGVRAPNKQPKPNLSGKTLLITGSSSGIGLACAKMLPGLHLSHLILAVRTTSKGEAVAAPLRKAHPKCKISVWELDMLSYPNIQAFARRCESLERLDIAVLNAGVGFSVPSKTCESTGHEETVQVNYLSTALLSILLLPILSPQSASSPPGRLTIVGSGTALFAQFAEHTKVPLLPAFDVPFSGTGAASERYGTSKVLVLMLVHQLSQYVSSNQVIINTVEPGLTSGTTLHKDFSGGGKALMGLMKKLSAKTPEQAANTYIDAFGVQGKESHGGFIMFWEVCAFPKVMHTDEGRQAMARLWDETMVELQFAGVAGILERLDQK